MKLLSTGNIFVIALIFALSALVFENVLLYIITLLIIVFILIIYGQNAIVILSILSFLVLVSDINQTLRLITNISCFLLLSALFVRNYGINTSELSVVPKQIILFLLVFYAAIIFSTVLSDYVIEGFQKIMQVSIFFILIYLFYSSIKNIKQIYSILFALSLSAIIICGSILYEFILNNYNLAGLIAVSQTRTAGILSNVNAPGGLVISVLPIGVNFLFYKRYKYKSLTIIAILLILGGVLLSTSRSAFLAIVASITFVLYLHFKKKLLYGLLIIIISLIILYLIPDVQNTVNLLFRIESGLSQRNYLWEISANMIADYPFWGIGPGSYSHLMLNYFPVMFNTFIGNELLWLREVTWGTNNSHNFFLFYFSDMGILGLISSIILPYSFFAIAIQTMKRYKAIKPAEYYIVSGIIAAGIGLFVRSLFEGIGILTYGWIKVDLPFWLLFSILVFIYYHESKITQSRHENITSI